MPPADGVEAEPETCEHFNQTVFQGASSSLNVNANDNNWVVMPDSAVSKRMDLVVFLALFFTATVTPYEVALLETKLNPRFLVNCVVDFVYISDLVRNFFLAYESRETQTLIKDLALIRHRYMHGWFAIDFLSIIPFDMITIVADNDKMARMKTVKIIRLLRLLKLVKVLKSSAMFDRYKAKFTLSFSLRALLKNCGLMMVISHWFACLWLLVATLQCDVECMNTERSPTTWLTTVEDHDMDNGLPSFTAFERYRAALYWAATTLTSVGYVKCTTILVK
jgi:hypothetical protein